MKKGLGEVKCLPGPFYEARGRQCPKSKVGPTRSRNGIGRIMEVLLCGSNLQNL